MMDQSRIEMYAQGAEVPGRAIEGLTNEELNSFPVPGAWSIQQLVFHLMDSDLIASDRMKRVIAEENPTLIGYNETLFTKHLHYDKLDAAMACEVFRLNRLLTAEVLRRLPSAAFNRVGHHNEKGTVTLGGLVESYIEHLDHHMKFLLHKREALGKPLAGA